MEIFYTAADVAREFGLTRAGARFLAKSGHLQAAARTPRGAMLFDPATVARVKRERERARSSH